MDNLVIKENDDGSPTSNFRKLRHIVPADDIADGFSDAEVENFLRAADAYEEQEDD